MCACRGSCCGCSSLCSHLGPSRSEKEGSAPVVSETVERDGEKMVREKEKWWEAEAWRNKGWLTVDVGKASL